MAIMDENKSGMRTQRIFACCGSDGLVSCGIMLFKGGPGDEEDWHFCKSAESGDGVSIRSVHRFDNGQSFVPQRKDRKFRRC